MVLEHLGGETLHRLSKHHDTSRNPIRVRIAKHEAGEFGEVAEAADPPQQHEAGISAPERWVGHLALEIGFPRGV